MEKTLLEFDDKRQTGKEQCEGVDEEELMKQISEAQEKELCEFLWKTNSIQTGINLHHLSLEDAPEVDLKLDSEGNAVYTMQIKDFQNKMDTWKVNRTIDSQIFKFQDLEMYIRVFPNGCTDFGEGNVASFLMNAGKRLAALDYNFIYESERGLDQELKVICTIRRLKYLGNESDWKRLEAECSCSKGEASSITQSTHGLEEYLKDVQLVSLTPSSDDSKTLNEDGSTFREYWERLGARPKFTSLPSCARSPDSIFEIESHIAGKNIYKEINLQRLSLLTSDNCS